MDKTKFTDRPGDSEGFITQDGTHIVASCFNVITETPTMVEIERLASQLPTTDECLVNFMRPSPWSLLDQDHLDRIFDLWVNSSPAIQRHLERLHAEATEQA